MPVGVFYVANHVKCIVLRTLITVVQLTGQVDAEDKLNLILKLDAASLKQRQSSHVVVWGGDNLSSWV